VVDKNKHQKMTDHVAEQIELKFKAATAPQQPPTKLVWPISTISRLLSQSEMVLNQVNLDADDRCVLSLRTCVGALGSLYSVFSRS
jgi:hypothetical protein